MMKPAAIVRRINQAARKAGVEVEWRSGKGSHRFYTVGDCMTTVPFHRGEEVGRGLLRKIEADLAPCLGDGWLTG